MATDLERLTVQLEANIRSYEKGLQRATSVTDQRMRQIEDRARKTSKTLDATLGAGLAKLGGAAVGVGALTGFTALIDANTRVQNSLKVTGLAGDELAGVLDRLYASAQRNGVGIEELTKLYSQAAQSAKNLGASQQEIEQFTGRVALSLRVSGKSTQEAAGALLQLTQVLGGATVQAEEYGSLIDGAQPLLKAVATGLREAGGEVSKLTVLVKEGKVSSKTFFDAFQAGSAILDQMASTTNLTVDQAMEGLRNTLIRTAGELDTATGSTQSMANAIDALGRSIDALGNNKRLGLVLGFLAQLGDKTFDGTVREIELLTGAIEGILGATEDAFKRATGQAVGTLGELDAAVRQVLATALGFSDPALLPEALRKEVGALSRQLEEGTLDVAALQAQLLQLGGTRLEMDQIVRLDGFLQNIRLARAEAAALVTTLNGPAGPALPRGELGRRRRSRVEPVSILDNPVVPATPAAPSHSAAPSRETYEPALSAVNELSDAQTRLNDQVREWQDTVSGAATNFVQGMLNGQSAAEALQGTIRDLASQLVDIAIKNLVGQAFGGLLGGGGGWNIPSSYQAGGFYPAFPGRANGGPVTAGQPYIVGERRPELFVPNTSGYIVPKIPAMGGNGGGAGGSPVRIDVVVSVNDDGKLAAIASQSGGQAAQVVLRTQGPGMVGQTLASGQGKKLMRDVYGVSPPLRRPG